MFHEVSSRGTWESKSSSVAYNKYMFSSGSSFIGIDPTAGHKPFAYAALDDNLRLNALGEARLRHHRISCYKTPSDEKACPNWMQMGFHLYRRLEQMGYQAYPSNKPALQWLEVFPTACFFTPLG